MVTTEQLRKQIKAEQMKIDKAKEKQSMQLEKVGLEKQLKMLRRSPGTTKNIALAQRTGRGLKRIASVTGSAILKQARLIKEQQLREDAAFKRSGKKLSTNTKKVRKKSAKRTKKRGKTFSKNLKKAGKSITFQIN